VSKLRKDDEAHGQKRRGTRDCGINHRKHAIGIRAHLSALDWIREVRLATGN
jgi:hypothetical protein